VSKNTSFLTPGGTSHHPLTNTFDPEQTAPVAKKHVNFGI